ncbi:farnesyltransferase beta subunit [Klebsormidium nitens]|uniref:Protein farnesyltransferase subunit beta n=1 Tax=Klebsormidium nitens TaxID=105231 RepID=A0A1Y1I5D3_KLENI|nr:farnesyltransferase beta subunit [Klebsormidium nitens]|eukprot:GAQ85162.1 farnesyltransferase beta subunit [Klebsormidium nitens]
MSDSAVSAHFLNATSTGELFHERPEIGLCSAIEQRTRLATTRTRGNQQGLEGEDLITAGRPVVMARDDPLVTATSREQAQVAALVGGLFQLAAPALPQAATIQLRRRQHVAYLERGLDYMGPGYAVLDSSRPWLCYWILHSLALLGQPITPDVRNRCIDFLKRCQDPRGGYGGGPGQLPHLATTYAAVCALVTVGGAKALDSIDRPALLSFLVRMKAAGGGFHVHADGEVDVRGSYCALAVAHLLNLTSPQLTAGVGAYVATCQTYEGGIGGEPGVEAHGGYTFCGLAAALLAGEAHLVALPRLLGWLVARQGAAEGGFQGRTNKLVDGCYSFWQGGTALLLQRVMPQLAAQAGGAGRGAGSGDQQGRRTEAEAGVEGLRESPSEPGARREQEGSSERERWGDEESTEQEQGRGGANEGRSDGAGEKNEPRSTAGASAKEACTEEAQTAADESAETACEETPGGSGRSEREWARKEAVQADRGGEPDSADSSEYETDDESAGPGRGGVCSAAELFPAEPLAEPGEGGGAHLVIEEEEAAGRRTPAVRREGRGDEAGRAGHGGTGGLGEALLNARALQAYILVCCQQADGGLRDKPGKSRDYYHTCYCLSGLSAAQRCHGESVEALPQPRHVLGPYSNLLEAADPVCNVHAERYAEAIAHFASRPVR